MTLTMDANFFGLLSYIISEPKNDMSLQSHESVSMPCCYYRVLRNTKYGGGGGGGGGISNSTLFILNFVKISPLVQKLKWEHKRIHISVVIRKAHFLHLLVKVKKVLLFIKLSACPSTSS
jgi:hypothetical protein